MKIYLVGFMGCGKTSIGSKAASMARMRFYDTDREVEKILGKSVAEIFSQMGEATFRSAEREVLALISASREDMIIATGGGLPCVEQNMSLISSSGFSVYLQRTPRKLALRLAQAKTIRPKLKGLSDGELEDYIAQTLAEREKFYSKASMTINCDGASDNWIINHILQFAEHIRNQNENQPELK